MPPSLKHSSLIEGFRVLIMLRGLQPRAGNRGTYLANLDPHAVIAHLEPIRMGNSRDWFVRYFLGDFYLRAKRYLDGLNVLLEAYDLRPRDPRSTYALATAYRDLSRGGLEGFTMDDFLPVDRTTEFLRRFPEAAKLFESGQIDFDPSASADELEKTGLTVDEVALRAMFLFDETLRLGVRAEDAPNVQQTLQRMYIDFPHLEMRAKALRNTAGTVFGESRKGPGALFNEAVGHYTRLRFLFEDPPRYRFELGEVVRLCQWVIAADQRDGDAHVLLANAYSLLNAHVAAKDLPRNHYMQFAGAVLYHWATTPLRNYPFTKNSKIAEVLLADVVQDLARNGLVALGNPMDGLKAIAERNLASALSPASFKDVKEHLEGSNL